MSNLIEKYNIEEEDLYKVCFLLAEKSKASFNQKEKLSNALRTILKDKYNVSITDWVAVEEAIRSGGYHYRPELKEKYGQVEVPEFKAAGLKYIVPILIGVIAFFIVYTTMNTNSDSQDSNNTHTSLAVADDSDSNTEKELPNGVLTSNKWFVEKGNPNTQYDAEIWLKFQWGNSSMPNNTVEAWEEDNYSKSCTCNGGKYTINEARNQITISGLDNSNCSWMRVLNGTYSYHYDKSSDGNNKYRFSKGNIVITHLIAANRSMKGSSYESKNSTPEELSDSEKKLKCLRMFGGGSDLSAWETAQSECLLYNSPSACECMLVLSK